jgi:Do/DeqQ family serine protease
VGPAVVKIETTVTTRGRTVDPFFNDPFFREFFGRQFLPPEARVRQELGSGVIISQDGYILTNEHVIGDAQEIQVTIVGRSKPVRARVVGADHDLDLAVLKVDAGSNLPTLKLGNSDQVAVGEWVIAIGNPYGLDHTVTVGVISAKGRPITVEDRSYRNLLQTDASINPGNSGGPLLTLQGEVIGINTAVSTQAQGIGFAIPSNTVKGVLEDLIKKGKVSRGWLGVEIQDVTPAIADYFGLSRLEGVLIRNVVSGGPAARSGLRSGDIVLAWNGNKIESTEDLLQKIQEAGPGKKVQLTIWRDRRSQQISVTLDERP